MVDLMLDLRRLRYFVGVAELENVGRAAAQLAISQSPLSRQIQELEAELGLSLFRRERKRLHLTRQGQSFLREAKMLLAHADSVKRKARSLAEGSDGELAVGFVEGAVHSGLLPRGLREFHRGNEGVRVHLHAMRSADQIDALRRGILDVALIYTLPQDRDDLSVTKLTDEPFVLAVPRSRFPRRRRIKPAELRRSRFIASLNPVARAEMLVACNSLGFEPDIVVELGDPAAVLRLVAADVGYALVQRSIGEIAPPGVTICELPDFPLRVRIHAATKAHPDEQADAFRRALASASRPSPNSRRRRG